MCNQKRGVCVECCAGEAAARSAAGGAAAGPASAAAAADGIVTRCFTATTRVRSLTHPPTIHNSVISTEAH